MRPLVGLAIQAVEHFTKTEKSLSCPTHYLAISNKTPVLLSP
jgi:hypothetical protein